MKPGDEYTCDHCHGRFRTVTPEGDALAEAEQIFGEPLPPDDRAVLCDPCWRKFMVWFEELTPEDHRAIRAGERGGFP